MDAACNLVYVDRSVRQERMVRRGEAVTEAAQEGDGASLNEGARRLQKNLETLLQTFSKGKCVAGVMAWPPSDWICATRVDG